MNMQQQEPITTTPVGSDTTGVGAARSIVPAPGVSSSDDGPPAVITAGTAKELVTAVSKPVVNKEALAPNGDVATCNEPDSHRSISADTVIVGESSPPCLDAPLKDAPPLESQSWVTLIEEEERAAPAAGPSNPATMDIDEERIAFKRKKCRVVDTDSLDDSASDLGENKTRSSIPRKKAILSLTQPNLDEGKEDPGCTTNENEPSGTDVEGKRKVGRPRRKVRAIDPLIAEQQIIQRTGKAPDAIEAELLQNMTVSDISALALEYIEAIEIIRTKSGRLQGGLSGELRRRTQGLSGFVRALQERAEHVGDPHALQIKIDELLQEMKENKKEEERRKREISELQDTIKELRQENKSIRLEMRRTFKEIRSSIGKETYANNEDGNPINIKSQEDWPTLPSRDTTAPPLEELPNDWVYRPPLLGKSIAIPIRNDSVHKEIPSMVFSNKDNVQAKRTDIRVISNVQIKPPRAENQQRGTSARPRPTQPPRDLPWTTVGKDGKALKQKKEKVATRTEKKRLPKTAAVSLKGKSSDFSYAEALKRIRSQISLQELDIQMPKVRRGISGNAIIEIHGPDNALKADRLASEIQRVLQEEAYVSRPTITGEIKLIGMDESISKEEIIEAVSTTGNCKPSEVRSGKIGRTRNGAGIVWVQCPKTAAILLTEKKRIPIGWSTVRVESLKKRPLQCHRCWQIGHVRVNCKSSKDHSGSCFRCGKTGHSVSTCKNQVRCILCSDLGKDYNHRMGSIRCTGITVPSSDRKPAFYKAEAASEDTSHDQITSRIDSPDRIELAR
ncbi:uncharacterized protein LOC112639147 [Camponotus floridanus]|uniref:uncharacterized protein LOC112639147 n=1 Tax=Camponotus floridanus TaxID=104421 RepID=UPI000DC69640|nr:uncharacterized protein LOC112639147 [Camponotus floridanus]